MPAIRALTWGWRMKSEGTPKSKTRSYALWFRTDLRFLPGLGATSSVFGFRASFGFREFGFRNSAIGWRSSWAGGLPIRWARRCAWTCSEAACVAGAEFPQRLRAFAPETSPTHFEKPAVHPSPLPLRPCTCPIRFDRVKLGEQMGWPESLMPVPSLLDQLPNNLSL